MIEYIKGEVAELTPTRIIIETHGIGYELHISLHTHSILKEKTEAKCFVVEVIRDDAHLLFGFAERDERELFLLLTSVSGVGPNTARTILSSLPPRELTQAILKEQELALKSVKGIGLKTAQRIIIDLKGKVKPYSEEDATAAQTSIAMGGAPVDRIEEATAALVMLGFQKASSQKAVLALYKSQPTLSVEQAIKAALRML